MEESDDATAGTTYTMVDLFKNSSMACITVNIMFQWFVNTMTYYGLLFGAGELPGSGIRFKPGLRPGGHFADPWLRLQSSK